VRDVGNQVNRLMPSAKITYTGEVGADPRNYRVKFDLLYRLLPDFKLKYNLATGMEELHRKMVEHAIVTGTDTATAGLLTMTDLRWRQTIDFLKNVGLAKPNVDYGSAFTLSIIRDVKVLP